MPKKVHEPHIDVSRPTVNKSTRSSGIDTIVLHDTESHDRAGNSDLEGLLGWFATPSSQVSIHVIVDGEGKSARCVSDDLKAWHCMEFNSRSLGIEQVGFATFTSSVWNRNKRAQLIKVARWIAYWSKKYGIPIRDARKGGPGVRTHASLGAAGGGHGDPGANYPFKAVLSLAKYYAKRGW